MPTDPKPSLAEAREKLLALANKCSHETQTRKAHISEYVEIIDLLATHRLVELRALPKELRGLGSIMREEGLIVFSNEMDRYANIIAGALDKEDENNE